MSSGPTPGVRPQDVLRVVAGHGGDGAGLVVHVGPRLAAAADHRLDHAPAYAGSPSPGRCVVTIRAVPLSVSTQQSSRCSGLHDHAAAEHVVHGDPLLVVGLRVVGGVLGVNDLHVRHLLGRGAVVVHVTHEGLAEHLPGAVPAVGARSAARRPDGAGRRAAGAADAHLAVAVHRPEDRPPCCTCRPRSRPWRCRSGPRCSSRRRRRPCGS